MIQAVLFDLDGTLIDSRKDLVEAVNHARQSIGLEPQAEGIILPHVGNGLTQLLQGVLGAVDEEEFQAAVSSFKIFYADHCVDNTVLYPGVLNGLRRLAALRKIGIVTNKPFFFADKILKELKVRVFVSVLMGGDSLPEKKPHPAPLLRAIEEMRESVDTSLMVGDGEQDVGAGKKARIKTCLARYGYGFREELLSLKPDFVIDEFDQLKEIVP